ncbi:MAG: OsmC family protein [Pyrinomonadaceae bacterium]|nr:OsmC family protein [Pyrinomonadaceae bacterium]
MSSEKIKFENSRGEMLSARIALPKDQTPHNFAVFAHCFTCNKNFKAVRYITQALTDEGFGVLSFDFTGLGESEGDFSDTTFSSSVDDLICAANYLEENHRAPNIAIGHSLGGAAVILAASQLDEIKAVVTIGTPSAPQHVKHLLRGGIEEIREKGIAEINIGGRPFNLKKEFIDDLERQDLSGIVKGMRKSFLFMHSPQDTIVGIENAAELYQAAHHPKSFVSLDGADHLLSKEIDGCYAGDVIANWAKRYIDIPEAKKLSTKSHIVAYLGSEEKFTTQIKADQHHLTADEPKSFGGNDFGPSPYQLVASGLAACTVMTLRMYAGRKKWDLREVFCHVRHEKTHLEDCDDCENPKARIDKFTRELEFIGDLDPEQKQRLLEIADKCPVHRTLEGKAHIETEII